MTHTVPYTRAEQDKTIANAVNHAFRHCRIGKVTPKPSAAALSDARFAC
ncbi:hypothetical protein G6L12_08365 [Agrobacterium rhizogenes]|nr:hypothetical protein [Rhizobium rhizogenes]NTF74486.1 hypothetical protein [Rhizobium rhizogenes]